MSKKFIRILIFIFLIPLVIYGGRELLSMQREERSDKAATANATQADLDIDSSSSTTVVVNKHRQLKPADYVPAGLSAPGVTLRLSTSSEEMKLTPLARAALETMFQAAKSDGISLMLASAYRSHATQEKLHAYYVNKQGQAAADRESARAGYSEHQTGLAADVAPANGKCSVEVCFAELPEGKWVASHAHVYGFIIRYPDGKEPITGYTYEPWHLRYVGTGLSAKLQSSAGQTLEEYFELGPAPDYN